MISTILQWMITSSCFIIFHFVWYTTPTFFLYRYMRTSNHLSIYSSSNIFSETIHQYCVVISCSIVAAHFVQHHLRSPLYFPFIWTFPQNNVFDCIEMFVCSNSVQFYKSSIISCYIKTITSTSKLDLISHEDVPASLIRISTLYNTSRALF